MKAAYVDTSAIVAVAFEEPAGPAVSRALERLARLVSSNLLEAELRATFAREGFPMEKRLLSGVDWIHPDRPLSGEIAKVLRVGYLKGADLWHMATALYIAEDHAELSFVTLDKTQESVAARLGFPSWRTIAQQ